MVQIIVHEQAAGLDAGAGQECACVGGGDAVAENEIAAVLQCDGGSRIVYVRLSALKTVDHKAVELLAEDGMVEERWQVGVPCDFDAADDASIHISAKEGGDIVAKDREAVVVCRSQAGRTMLMGYCSSKVGDSVFRCRYKP